jgi:hypothetical protein
LHQTTRSIKRGGIIATFEIPQNRDIKRAVDGGVRFAGAVTSSKVQLVFPGSGGLAIGDGSAIGSNIEEPSEIPMNIIQHNDRTSQALKSPLFQFTAFMTSKSMKMYHFG